MRMSMSTSRVRTLPCARRVFILVDERWFRTHLMDLIGFLNGCYFGQVLDDGHTQLLRVPTKMYVSYEAME